MDSTTPSRAKILFWKFVCHFEIIWKIIKCDVNIADMLPQKEYEFTTHAQKVHVCQLVYRYRHSLSLSWASVILHRDILTNVLVLSGSTVGEISHLNICICVDLAKDLFGLSYNCKMFDVWKLKMSQIYSAAFVGGKSHQWCWHMIEFWSQSFAVYCELLFTPEKLEMIPGIWCNTRNSVWSDKSLRDKSLQVSVTLHEKWKRVPDHVMYSS